MDFISKEEKVNLSMRRLYELYGYTKYRMNKFEEYSFYLQNKNFLEHDKYITFNDADGRLMALKPDVTLSIVKNASTEGGNQRIYYSESIFRTGKGSKEFAELRQTGLEFIGSIDVCSTVEVLSLALKTLGILSPSYVLSLSHMGIISQVLDGLDYKLKRRITACLKGKNRHELEKLCAQAELDEGTCTTLLALVGIRGDIGKGVETLLNMDNVRDLPAVKELCQINHTFKDTEFYKHIQLDFSQVSSTEYYNGILLSGFVEGVATEVLTGGRYDNLLERMGKQGMQAMGFAVNFCFMEQLLRREQSNKYCAVLYDETTDAGYLCRVLEEITSQGRSVRATSKKQYNGDCQEVLDISGGRRAE